MDSLTLIAKPDQDWEAVLVLDVKHANLEDDFTYERAIRFLSLPQQAKIHQLKTIKGRHNAVCNKILQMFGCSIASGVPFNKVRFEQGTYGKPRLKGTPNISFSMSNGQDHIVQYISRRIDGKSAELGVDIASRDDYLGEQDLETFCEIFSETEYNHLRSLPGIEEKRSTFATYWSLKESYSKYTGLGLNCDLSQLDYGKIDVPKVGTGLQRLIEGNPMIFYSIFVSPGGKEIVTVCRKDDLNEPDLSDWLNHGPPIYYLALEDVIGYLEQARM